MLDTRPTKRLVKVVRFGPFSSRRPYTLSLSDSVIEGYESYILNNFKPFEEDILREKEDREYRLFSLAPVSEKRDSCENILFQTSHRAPSEEAIRQTVKKESFSDMLIRLQNSKGLSSPELYKSAGIDFRHFSKIVSDKDYKPKKETALALAIALRLDVDETEEFIGRAGYAFSPSILFDMTVRYFIQNGIYDRNTIDLLMDSMKLPLLPQNWDVRHN